MANSSLGELTMTGGMWIVAVTIICVTTTACIWIMRGSEAEAWRDVCHEHMEKAHHLRVRKGDRF